MKPATCARCLHDGGFVSKPLLCKCDCHRTPATPTGMPSEEAMEKAQSVAHKISPFPGVCTGVRGLDGRWHWHDGVCVERARSIAHAIDAAIAEERAKLTQWKDDADQSLPEDAEIEAAHPCETGDHATYAEALRMVSARRSKYALVGLVNWLLRELERSTKGGKR